MRNLTAHERLKFVEEENKFCEENKDFVADIKQVAFLMKGSVNFDKGINILSPGYDGAMTQDERAFVMANVETALHRAGLFKEDRTLHDCNEEYREMFVGMCPNTNEKAITIFAIDDSFKDEFVAQMVNFVDDKKIIILAVGKKYEDFLDKLGTDNTEIIETFIHMMKEFIKLAYPNLNQYYAIPSALSSLFLTVASFYPTEFENNLFADEEHGWFYSRIFDTDKYKEMSYNNLKDLIKEEDVVSSDLLDEISPEDLEELSDFNNNVIMRIIKFLSEKPKATEDDKRAIKRFDYMKSKKEKYIKDVEIDEWLDTPLYTSICEYKNKKYIIAVSECFSRPKFTSDFPAGNLITVPGDITVSEKEIVKVAYDILELIAYDSCDDEESKIHALGGIFAIASGLNFDMFPDTFELIPDGYVKSHIEKYLEFREEALKIIKSTM